MTDENCKIAIITGGSRGLGRNTAIHLARRGVDILFTYRANQKEATRSSTMSKRCEGKQPHFGSIPVTFTHLTDWSLMSARRCTVGEGIGSTIW